jgi:thiosulfate/3-mercaptopyruvate sulfurtransferase
MLCRPMASPDPEILVETAELAEQLDDPDLRVFDCTVFLEVGPDGLDVRSGRADWAAAHIPGSDFLDLLEELSDTAAPYNFMAPTAEAFAEAMSAHGVEDGKRVVLYDRRGSMWACRVWWLLHAFGFDDAAVLNGGWTKWTLEGRPTSSASAAYPRGRFDARPRPGAFVGRDDVIAGIAGGTCLLNGLSEDTHRGTGPTVPGGRPGHIPTSKSMPGAELVDPETHAFLPLDELRARLEQRGALSADAVITYCGGGIDASGIAFTLTLLGYEDVSVYDASLEEWATDPSLPIETG